VSRISLSRHPHQGSPVQPSRSGQRRQQEPQRRPSRLVRQAGSPRRRRGRRSIPAAGSGHIHRIVLRVELSTRATSSHLAEELPARRIQPLSRTDVTSATVRPIQSARTQSWFRLETKCRPLFPCSFNGSRPLVPAPGYPFGNMTILAARRSLDLIWLQPRRVQRVAAGFSQIETCLRLSLVNGSRFHPLQRSRSLIPASCAIRSSSEGHA
jgi:hypothetical protein